MRIELFEPLTRGWRRMVKALFKPFNLSKWLTVGFTAFLAGLLESNGGGKGGGGSKDSGRFDWDEFLHFPETAWNWLTSHPGWFALIIFGTIVLITILIVLTWLSSRGKFMFLDNVVHDRAKVADPWHQFKSQGNSLFLWRLGFGLICFIMVFGYFALCFNGLVNLYHSSFNNHVMIVPAILMGSGMFLLIIFIMAVSGLLNDFVVPIMYKHQLGAVAAWNRFMPLFTSQLLYFIIYLLLVFCLVIVSVIVVVLAGFFTCCIGFLFLMIPYIGSVITLPISYTFRAFSLEFLAQFGEDYTLFPGNG